MISRLQYLYKHWTLTNTIEFIKMQYFAIEAIEEVDP